MAEQHTPGPWKWVSGEKPCHCELIQARYEGDGEDSILYHGANWHMNPADKALIAAAPDQQAKIDRLEAENKQVKELIAGNLKQIGELKHYLHERGRVIASLEAEKAELVEALKAFVDAFGKRKPERMYTGNGTYLFPDVLTILPKIVETARSALSKHTPVSEQGAEQTKP